MAAMDKPATSRTDRQQRLAAPWRAGRGAQTARDAARAHAARTEEHARTQLHQRALSIFNELEIAQHPKRTAPNGSAPAVQPCRRRRTAPCRSARDPARAASSNRTRQPTLTIASHIALRRSTSRRHTAQPNRPSCRPQRPGRVHGRRRDRRLPTSARGTPRGAHAVTTNDGRDASCHVRRETLRVAQKCIRRLCRWIVASRDRISHEETHGFHPLAVFN